MKCLISDCNNKSYCRGWCRAHYLRWQRLGDPLKGGPMQNPNATLAERFWAKVNKNGPIPTYNPKLGACWLWTASTNTDGYGRFTINKTKISSYRWSYENMVCTIPSDKQIDHLCRVRSCVNPNHLDIITSRVNTLRGETITSKNFYKTHCPRGHPYDAKNTRVNKQNRRECKTCNREKQRRYREESL